ncbi:nucleotidyltransferase domain-containing protein [Catellatospora coxensis]
MLEELWVTAAHVRALDERVRGLVTGLFVTGSVPLGDYWPGRSDIDFVAVMDREPTSAELAALGKVHLSLPDEMPGPDYDGIYLTRAQLAAPRPTATPRRRSWPATSSRRRPVGSSTR